jgi:hypothetical protein
LLLHRICFNVEHIPFSAASGIPFGDVVSTYFCRRP